MLIKRTERQPRRGAVVTALQHQPDRGLDRRSFLRRSGLVAGSLATLGALPLTSLRRAEAGPPPPAGAQLATRKNVCTHCSVGCSVIAEVANGVWIGQEPDYDSPINRGSHCCKGAAVRDDVLSERRLRYPVKLVDGQWTRVSWDQAIDEIGDKLLEFRADVGPGLRSIGSAQRSLPTKRPISTASSPPSGAPTTPIIRRGSATRRPSPASPIPGATAR